MIDYGITTMKHVTIEINYDNDLDTPESYKIDCLAAVNGRFYHDSLERIHKILCNADKHKNNHKKNMSDETKELLKKIRQDCAPHFKGLIDV